MVPGRRGDGLTATCWWVLRGSNPRPTPCKGAALPTELSTRMHVIQLTASLSALPGRNLGTLAALILMVAPVRGLRPERAARLLTLKVPKPTSDTLLFFLSVDFTPPIRASSARVAAALEMSACLAMCSISSDLFTKVPPQKRCLEKNLDGCGAGSGPRGMGQSARTITASGTHSVKRGSGFYA